MNVVEYFDDNVVNHDDVVDVDGTMGMYLHWINISQHYIALLAYCLATTNLVLGSVDSPMSRQMCTLFVGRIDEIKTLTNFSVEDKFISCRAA